MRRGIRPNAPSTRNYAKPRAFQDGGSVGPAPAATLPGYAPGTSIPAAPGYVPGPTLPGYAPGRTIPALPGYRPPQTLFKPRAAREPARDHFFDLLGCDQSPAFELAFGAAVARAIEKILLEPERLVIPATPTRSTWFEHPATPTILNGLANVLQHEGDEAQSRRLLRGRDLF
jgi:hypothetical protein